MKFFAEQISPNISRTPAGAMVAHNVPIARTGVQLYAPQEEPNIKPGPDGIIYVDRPEEEVFRPETIESFNGMPVVNDHPQPDETGNRFVLPHNWKELAVGTVMNVRRGEGTSSDVLMADLMIWDKEAIEDVLAGKREVSCGYAKDLIMTSEGHGFQKNIIGNHVALVQRGRCGVRCSIGDAEPKGARSTMKSWYEKLKAAIVGDKKEEINALLAAPPAQLTADEAAPHIGASKWNDSSLDAKFGEMEGKMSEMGKSSDAHHKAVMDSIEELKKKMSGEDSPENKEIEGALKEEAPAGTGDAHDSVRLADLFQKTVSLAEIIAPGITLPTYESAAPDLKTFKDICTLRSKALQVGALDAITRPMIETVRGRSVSMDSFSKLGCKDIRNAFVAVAAVKRAHNSTARNASADAARVIPITDKPEMAMSAADINKRNREFYQTKS